MFLILHCILKFNHTLLSAGANVNRATANNDHTVVSLACAGGHLAVVELLLAHGADPTHRLKVRVPENDLAQMLTDDMWSHKLWSVPCVNQSFSSPHRMAPQC